MTTTTGIESQAGTEATPLVQPQGLDHANLHVRDVAAAMRFYTEVLGLGVRDVMRRDASGRPTFVELGAGDQTVFLVEQPDYRPPADSKERGLNHICLLVDSTDPDQLQADLRARGVPIRGTRAGRNRREQPTFSVYVEDPDGHGVELEQALAP